MPSDLTAAREQLRAHARAHDGLGRGDSIALLDALDAAEKRAARKRCPCEFGSPCGPNCTCADRHQSGGCSRCCTYGNPEQQALAAASIIRREALANKPGGDFRDIGSNGPYMG